MLIMLNNEYLGLIRMAQDHGGYDMNYQVDLRYDEHGTDNVKIMEAYGCAAGCSSQATSGPSSGRARRRSARPGPCWSRS